MKIPRIPLPGTLLLAYSVYSAFVPISIAHSIVLFSLALLTGFDIYIQSHQLPSITKKIENLKNEMLEQFKKDKEIYEDKLQELKFEQSRQSIERANFSSAPSVKKPAIKF
jgi:cytochrome c-type biogenesis protein CcmH/NrfG